MTIEASGTSWPVEDVGYYPSLFGTRDTVFVDLANGGSFFVDFLRPAPLATELSFATSDGSIPPAGARFVGAATAEHGPRILCSSDDAGSEGSLVIRAESWDEHGNLDGLDATLRVRFVGCDATFDGVRIGDVTWIVELPGEGEPSRD